MNSKDKKLTIRNDVLSNPANNMIIPISAANMHSQLIKAHELANVILFGLPNLTTPLLCKGTEDKFTLFVSQLINRAPKMFAIIENKKIFIYFMA
jgi:hypothetical protein